MPETQPRKFEVFEPPIYAVSPAHAALMVVSLSSPTTEKQRRFSMSGMFLDF
jgi:hypothetical protein